MPGVMAWISYVNVRTLLKPKVTKLNKINIPFTFMALGIRNMLF